MLLNGTDITTQFTSGVTKSKIAEGSVSPVKRAEHQQELEPQWTRLVYNAGANYQYQLLSKQGTEISYANGNNGPSGIARVKGTTGHGDFIIMWTCYSWGYSGIYCADVAGYVNLDDPVDVWFWTKYWLSCIWVFNKTTVQTMLQILPTDGSYTTISECPYGVFSTGLNETLGECGELTV